MGQALDRAGQRVRRNTDGVSQLDSGLRARHWRGRATPLQLSYRQPRTTLLQTLEVEARRANESRPIASYLHRTGRHLSAD